MNYIPEELHRSAICTDLMQIGISDPLLKEVGSIVEHLYELVRHHYAHNDLAHDINHMADVTARSILYSYRIDLNNRILKECIMAAMVHDTFANPKQRKIHHMLAEKYVKENPVIDKLCQVYSIDKEAVAHAVFYHRASIKDNINFIAHPVTNVVSTADRRLVFDTNIDDLYAQFIQGKDNVVSTLAQHLYDKFNPETGYASVPPGVIDWRYGEYMKCCEICKNVNSIAYHLEQKLDEMISKNGGK